MIKKIAITLGVLLIIGGVCAFTGYYFVLNPNVTVKDDGIIYIREGDSFETVMITLQSKGYIKNSYSLRKIAEIKKYTNAIKAGRFQMRDGMNNNQVVNMLRSGLQAPIHFTFNNIRSMENFAGLVARQLEMDSVKLLQLALDPVYVEKFGFTTSNFIGMFIPNTYQIYWNTTEEEFMKRMNAEYRKFWNTQRTNQAQKAGLSPMDITILASIVEEETTQSSEYPIIAGVYINRLKKGWRLEACPTLKFALGDFTLKRVLQTHMAIDSPYNTYRNEGLPPGPVRMPSIQVIDAVLNYQHHDYMFFCAKSDFSGTHNFSRTLRQHNQYAAEYHRALNKRQIY